MLLIKLSKCVFILLPHSFAYSPSFQKDLLWQSREEEKKEGRGNGEGEEERERGDKLSFCTR